MSDLQKPAEKNLRAARESFYAKIGACITRWAEVEHILFDIFHAALGSNKTQAAVVFVQLPTFSNRLRMTDLLVAEVFPKRQRKNGGHDHPDKKNWDKVVSSIVDLTAIRNIIAHKPVMELVPTTVDVVSVLGSMKPVEQVFISPENQKIEMSYGNSFYEHSHPSETNPRVYLKANDLDAHLLKVNQAWRDLNAALKKVRAAKRQPKPRSPRPLKSTS